MSKGDQVARFQHLNHRIPLGVGEICPGRVVAARVQQHYAALWQGIQFFQQRVNAHAVGFTVEPWIGRHLKASTLKNRHVVFPVGSLTHTLNPGSIFQEVRTHFKRT